MAICPFAEWVPAPDWKHGYPSGDMLRPQGAVLHSAEGNRQSALDLLAGPKQASWHFFICRDGILLQHIDTSQIAWHARNPGGWANKTHWGFEHEGYAGEPLTDAQVDMDVRLLRWLWPEHGLETFSRQTLREHNEFTPTACPSGRIPWARLLDILNAPEGFEYDWLQEVKNWICEAVTEERWDDAVYIMADIGLIEGSH